MGVSRDDIVEIYIYPKEAIIIDENNPRICHKQCPNKSYMGYFKGYKCEKFGRAVHGGEIAGRCKECIELTNINLD